MMRARNRRELFSLVAGVLIGLLLGSVMIGTSESLRESLFGTAADSGGDKEQGVPRDVEYYLADLDSTLAWLTAQSSEDSAAIEAAIATLESLPSSPVFREDFQAARAQLDALLLPAMFTQLRGTAPADEQDMAKLNACLGMDDDPYSPTPTLYFYLTIPKVQSQTLSLPAQWEQLSNPKSNTLFWQLLACYPEPEVPAS